MFLPDWYPRHDMILALFADSRARMLKSMDWGTSNDNVTTFRSIWRTNLKTQPSSPIYVVGREGRTDCCCRPAVYEGITAHAQCNEAAIELHELTCSVLSGIYLLQFRFFRGRARWLCTGCYSGESSIVYSDLNCGITSIKHTSSYLLHRPGIWLSPWSRTNVKDDV